MFLGCEACVYRESEGVSVKVRPRLERLAQETAESCPRAAQKLTKPKSCAPPWHTLGWISDGFSDEKLSQRAMGGERESYRERGPRETQEGRFRKATHPRKRGILQ